MDNTLVVNCVAVDPLFPGMRRIRAEAVASAVVHVADGDAFVPRCWTVTDTPTGAGFPDAWRAEMPPTTPLLQVAGFLSTCAPAVVADVPWVVLVDGAHILPNAGNVSEVYNELFTTWTLHYGARVCTVLEYTYDAAPAVPPFVLLFEPGFMPPAALHAVLKRLDATTCLVYGDDVHCIAAARNCAASIGAVCCLAYADAADTTAILWPHAASAPFVTTPARGFEIERAPQCCLAGQVGRPLYPDRFAASFATTIRRLAGPVYDRGGFRRTAPADLCAAADECATVFVGGGVQHALVAKHYEFAARGAIVLTDPVSARRATQMGLACIGVASAQEIDAITRHYVPGKKEITNAAVVRTCHTVQLRARAMYALVVALSSRHWTPQQALSACRFPVASLQAP